MKFCYLLGFLINTLLWKSDFLNLILNLPKDYTWDIDARYNLDNPLDNIATMHERMKRKEEREKEEEKNKEKEER